MTITLSSAITVIIVIVIANTISAGLLDGILNKNDNWHKSAFEKIQHQLVGIGLFIFLLYMFHK